MHTRLVRRQERALEMNSKHTRIFLFASRAAAIWSQFPGVRYEGRQESCCPEPFMRGCDSGDSFGCLEDC